MRTWLYHGMQGHTLLWDGERWTCAADGCGFGPTADDAAARLHYYAHTEAPYSFTVLDADEAGELESVA